MAKISPVSIKYVIHAKFEAEGTVEKPDVIGALFGQTEGLLGEELELRELQKEGKIGRIDVNLKSNNSKTTGEIDIPCSIDKAETTIIAAALETIERIGPSDAKIEIEKIEDVRGSKREYIVERAKKLLEKIEGTSDTREIETAVKTASRLSRLKEYGTDNLPAGDISGEEVIVVEGRADVINLLKAKVNNVIAMNGTILPETIKELSLEKGITLFVDGDRGGKLIAKNAVNNARVDYVAVAPDGKEVEELTAKEILISLRKKIKIDEFLSEKGRGKKSDDRYKRTRDKRSRTRETPVKEKKNEEIKKLTDKETEKIRDKMDELIGTKGVVLLDDKLEVTKKIPLSQLNYLKIKDIYAILIDGTATSTVVRAAEKIGCKHLIARNFAFTETHIDLVSL
jgi:DNA primase